LRPRDIAEVTPRIRGYDRDPATTAMLADSICFQENFYRDNFYTFRASDGLGHAGEMSVHTWYHDDGYRWRLKYVDFAQHIRDWVHLVIVDG
jgi:hypothetical protein